MWANKLKDMHLQGKLNEDWASKYTEVKESNYFAGPREKEERKRVFEAIAVFKVGRVVKDGRLSGEWGQEPWP
jgi:hypothetical protein